MKYPFGVKYKEGGPGSGHHGHAGRPGERGGSTSGGAVGGFNEQAEFDQLMVRVGQQGKPKPGVTREQMARFFARRSATETAKRTAYRGGGTTIKSEVDKIIQDGFTNVKQTGRWTFLSGDDPDKTWRFGTKAEKDYIDVTLNRGNFKRNY